MSQSQDRRHGQDQRLRELVLQQGDFVARSLRNLGVWGGELDDCVQKVFLVAARRLPEIELGKERAFLFSCAQNTAAHFRRSLARKREVSEDALVDRTDPELLPDQLADRKRYREILDQLLETMDENIRATFVLYSFEEMTMAEIADVLGVPPGTVASRLRRAREIFRQEMTRLKLFDQFRTDQLRTKQETA
ncbi:MAG TPA: sigma-70 family RNA polymerase sigma factor [Polyangiaceae bacterium]|nr:sigma-70 family RNA polymerase sigma factor [Polyangiaceae bacterium]